RSLGAGRPSRGGGPRPGGDGARLPQPREARRPRHRLRHRRARGARALALRLRGAQLHRGGLQGLPVLLRAAAPPARARGGRAARRGALAHLPRARQLDAAAAARPLQRRRRQGAAGREQPRLRAAARAALARARVAPPPAHP
ncbi:hypothetical protein EMIHUDRAFT_354271, partial [Emiliania huxleyi CCMP1516]|uniref:Uncharacterized protein n=2 Tax=Emiliania huxleyi TaxID=2903 RepID=A0A0D3JNU0_EMIH1